MFPMDELLEAIASSLVKKRLPNDWRKFAPDTCMPLAEWLDHLQVLEPYQTTRTMILSVLLNVCFICFLFAHPIPVRCRVSMGIVGLYYIAVQ